MSIDDKFIKELDNIQGLMDVLIISLEKYEGREEEKELHNFYVHIKTRFCKYQVRHYEITGKYYRIDRVNSMCKD